ncbi:MAG: DEAD/DEAH box helicase [Deltaproteobacteria bacterium]|nr:DEAD/DEAH box helicase [Deltaproteobacteria bacterium]
MILQVGDSVFSTNPSLRPYGIGRVLILKNGIAKVEYSPGLFSEPPLYAHTKLLKIEEVQRVANPLELAAAGEWEQETWRYDLRQMAARFLTGNLGGQLSDARTEILPHQIFAAHKVVSSSRRRFLLADEVGLGKTIEAGMIWQALAQRGQAKRTLIICPAGLTVQWQEEMQDKFGQFFEIFQRDFHTINPRIWDLKACAIASLDCLKRKEHKEKLLENRKWDLIIFDEAHRLSAHDYGESKTEKTQNYRLADDLKEHTDAMLLLTATPHQGDASHSRFRHLLELLDKRIDFGGLDNGDLTLWGHAARESRGNGYKPYKDYILRTPKMNVTDSQGKKIFRGRDTHALRFSMFKDEATFYKEVSKYISAGYSMVEHLKDRKRRLAIGFVLTVFQKLASSSTHAIKAALYGRKMRLQDKYQRLPDAIDSLEPLFEQADERFEGEFEEKAAWRLKTDAEFIKDELAELERLIDMPVKQDRKLVELKELVGQVFSESEKGDKEKVLIFTEYRKTQDYLVEELQQSFGKGSVVVINGDMKLDQRKTSVQRFRDDESVRFLVSTESGGEGINLQFCHVLVNYDLPWNPMRVEQRVGRIYRFGQTKRVQVYNFRTKETVEDKIYGFLEQKIDIAAKALAGVTGEDPEDIKASMLGQLETEVDYNAIYKRAIVEQDIAQSKEEIEEGIKKARLAFEIATNSLFKDVSGYSFPSYERDLKTDVDLEALKDFTERFLQHHHRQVQKKDGLIEFLTPDILRGPGIEDRYSKVTFDRKAAIDNPPLTFLALGHPFVDRMLRFCGDVNFGGYCALKSIENPRVKACKGVHFNFVVRGRIQREDNEEFLFSLHPVFVRDDKTMDEKTAKASIDSYGYPPSEDICQREIHSNDGADRAFEIAKTYLQGQIGESIWDWDEDVSLLNLAAVVVEQ